MGFSVILGVKEVIKIGGSKSLLWGGAHFLWSSLEVKGTRFAY